MTVFQTTVAKTLQETLDEIMDDDSDGIESKSLHKKLFNVRSTTSAFIDDQEYGGAGLVSEKDEGGELATVTMRQGFTKRYVMRTYGAKMMITQEAMEDCKYKEVINLKRRLKRAMWKTVDYDATLVYMRATNAAFVGGDNVSLASASHTVPDGSVFSNQMATPLSPSKAALVVARTQMMQWPGHDGLIEGASIMSVVFPPAQWGIWTELVKSKMTPDAGNYAQINVVNSDIQPDLIENKYWQNTTTNWAIRTDAENGMSWVWRVRPESNSWVDNDNTVMKDSTRARWDRGWSDARGLYFVNA